MKYLLLLSLLLVSIEVFAQDLTKVVLSSKNSVSIMSVIDQESVAVASRELQTLCKANDLYLVLYTPGGSIAAGRMLLDFIAGLRCKVHTITIFAASMGYQIVQQLGNRYILNSGILMSHRAALSGLSGQIPGELNTQLAFLMEYTAELDEAAAKRVGIPLAQYQNEIRDELWLTGRSAVKRNHADKMITASCDASLNGTKKITVNLGIVSGDITVSKCPLIIGGVPEDSSDSESFNNFFNPQRVKVQKY